MRFSLDGSEQSRRRVFGGLPLDHIVIVRVRHRRSAARHAGVGDFAEEYGVGRGLHFVNDVAADVCACGVGDGHHAADGVGHAVEFVGVASGHKAESADYGRIAVLGDDCDCEFAQLFDHRIGIVVVIDADGNRRRRRGDLHRAVGCAARRASVVPSGDGIDAVREVAESFFVHIRLKKSPAPRRGHIAQ